MLGRGFLAFAFLVFTVFIMAAFSLLPLTAREFKTCIYAPNVPGYINASEDCVPRPRSDQNIEGLEPTAVCRNGQISYSQNKRGTCSSNRGVARWLR